jgi:hypothetical protein
VAQQNEPDPTEAGLTRGVSAAGAFVIGMLLGGGVLFLGYSFYSTDLKKRVLDLENSTENLRKENMRQKSDIHRLKQVIRYLKPDFEPKDLPPELREGLPEQLPVTESGASKPAPQPPAP